MAAMLNSQVELRSAACCIVISSGMIGGSSELALASLDASNLLLVTIPLYESYLHVAVRIDSKVKLRRTGSKAACPEAVSEALLHLTNVVVANLLRTLSPTAKLESSLFTGAARISGYI